METLVDNPYFAAGFGLVGVGAALAAARKGTAVLLTAAERRMLVRVEIPSKDKSYGWFLQWLGAQHARGPPARWPPLRTLARGAFGKSARPPASSKEPELLLLPAHDVSVETSFRQHENGRVEADVRLVPGPGVHFMRFNGAWVRLERRRERNMVDLQNASPWETVTLTTLARDRWALDSMLSLARTHALEREEGKLMLFTAWGPEWRPFGQPRRRRPLESIVLDSGIREALLQDLQQFVANAAWYHERGIPHRRGYLLHGPPGSGKSSVIQALAGRLEYNICILNISDSTLSDDRLAHLLSALPPRSFVLLEDVDAAFAPSPTPESAAARRATAGLSSVTFSGVLNALDGVASAEERIVFMTTNHVERLDPALIRPGRIDRQFLLGNATAHQARALFEAYFPGNDAEAASFVASLEANGWLGRGSMAQLQNFFVQHHRSSDEALLRVGDLDS